MADGRKGKKKNRDEKDGGRLPNILRRERERERKRESKELKRAKKAARIIYNCIYIIQDTKRAQGPKARSKMAVTIKMTNPAAAKRRRCPGSPV